MKKADLPQKISAVLNRLFPAFFREAGAFRLETGLAIGHLRILKFVSMGLNRVGKLSEFQCTSQPAMSKMVDHLVQAGYLKRGAHVGDRRQIELTLQPKAEALLTQFHQNLVQKITRQTGRLSLADRKKLEQGLDVVLSLFEEAS
jgi:DNA-binding MarR family transcriptional regulator